MLDGAGHNGIELLEKANAPETKERLRENTEAAKARGICGVPTYLISRKNADGQWKSQGGLVWGQDETNVVEDMIAGWDPEWSIELAEPRKGKSVAKPDARL